jgi:conflict system pore-forming effector with SLATT domain
MAGPSTPGALWRHLKRRRVAPAPRPALQPEDFPALQRAGEDVSATSQQLFTRWVKATLLLTVLAAVMGAVEDAWAGWVAAGAFAVSLVLGVLSVRRDVEARWYDARALVETVKSMTWKYAVGSSEYPVHGERAARARERFDKRLKTLLPLLQKLDLRPPQDRAGTNELEALRAADLSTRAAAYLEGRLHDQLQWYSLTALHHRAWARLWQAAAALLQLAGIAGAAAKGLDKTSVDWLGIAAAAAAAAAAWLQTKDHVTLSRAYTVTAHELALIDEEALPQSVLDKGDADAESRWAAFVDDSEEAISREHNLWLGRRRRTDDGT